MKIGLEKRQELPAFLVVISKIICTFVILKLAQKKDYFVPKTESKNYAINT